MNTFNRIFALYLEHTSTDLLSHTYYRDPYFDFTYVCCQLTHACDKGIIYEYDIQYMDCVMCLVTAV